GALWNIRGTATVAYSTFFNNSASDSGGAIENYAGLLTISNSTISSNRTIASQGVGGIASYAYLYSDAMIQVVNTTISNNSGVQIALNQAPQFQSLARFRNTIVASNGAQPNFVANNGAQFLSQGHNLSSDNTGNLMAEGDQPNTDPMLGPLQDNGGPT